MVKKGQISFEYVMLMGFIMVAIGVIMIAAFVYSNSVKDQVKSSQMTSCMNKIISTSESVFYAGAPSKSTIKCYLPDNIRQINISDNSTFIEYSTSTGTNYLAFTSNVPLMTTDTTTPLVVMGGMKTFVITATTNGICIELSGSPTNSRNGCT